MKEIIVTATTILEANSGNLRSYAIQFHLDLESGKIYLVKEKRPDRMQIRPNNLLLLGQEILHFVKVETKKEVFYTPEYVYGKTRPYLWIKCGKTYRLDHQVDANWITNPDFWDMVKFTKASSKDMLTDPTMYVSAYGWNWIVQEI